MEFTLSSVIALVFGDQYRTMAVYYTNEDGANVLSAGITLRDRSSGTSSPKYHKMRYDESSGILSINEMTTNIPPASDAGWRDYDFDTINAANYVWLDNYNIIIGTGDIRGGSPFLLNYDLKAKDVIITSFGKHSLRMYM